MPKEDLEKSPTLEEPSIGAKDTVRVVRPLVDTVELPAIPSRLITDDLAKQAELVLNGMQNITSDVAEDNQEVDRESALRIRLAIQLEKISKFLDHLLRLYRHSFPTLPEQVAIYNRTLDANIEKLQNNEIKARDAIVSIKKIVLPLLEELHMLFSNDEYQGFKFAEVKAEINECLQILVDIITKKRKG